MTQHEIMMNKALVQARKAYANGEVPIGAVLVKDGKVLATGRNKRDKTQIATKHAEIVAIESACKKLKSWRLNDCELYVTLEPCAMCLGACFNARIKKVYFGAYDQKGGVCGGLLNLAEFNQLNHNIEVQGGILLDECQKLLKDFFAQKRETK
ncbi:MAG: tRNA adenosine(34) deaminase TadA [Clostridia bacterium]|nr:tRNA adenosine(34) deaminase TadA [Clostridia bacterium]